MLVYCRPRSRRTAVIAPQPVGTLKTHKPKHWSDQSSRYASCARMYPFGAGRRSSHRCWEVRSRLMAKLQIGCLIRHSSDSQIGCARQRLADMLLCVRLCLIFCNDGRDNDQQLDTYNATRSVTASLMKFHLYDCEYQGICHARILRYLPPFPGGQIEQTGADYRYYRPGWCVPG
jgi:hypothetical protein